MKENTHENINNIINFYYYVIARKIILILNNEIEKIYI